MRMSCVSVVDFATSFVILQMLLAKFRSSTMDFNEIVVCSDALRMQIVEKMMKSFVNFIKIEKFIFKSQNSIIFYNY